MLTCHSLADDVEIRSDSFDNTEDRKHETVHNKKYETVDVNNSDNTHNIITGNINGEETNMNMDQCVDELPQYSMVKKKKKKKKEIKGEKKAMFPRGGVDKEPDYNKLVHTADNKTPCVPMTVSQKDNYSVLHVSEAGDVEDVNATDSRNPPLPSVDFYEEVPPKQVAGDGQDEESLGGPVHITGDEVVYYNDVAVKRSNHHNDKNTTQNDAADENEEGKKNLDIYTRSVSMGAPDNY